MKIVFAFFILFVFTYLNSFSQLRMNIDGVVLDSISKDPLPYTNIHFQKNRIGTISYSDGSFTINTNIFPDTLVISAIGYNSKFLPINQNSNYQLTIELSPKKFELNEIVIRPGENPANIIMKKVIDEKDRNNPMNTLNIACNTYTKVMVNTLNDSEEHTKKKGIPIYFSEKISQNIIQKDPFFEKGKIIAEKQEGLGFLKEMSIIGYSNNLSLGYNFYDNVIEIFDKPFLSPLSNRAFMFYKYYLKDSLISDHGKEYLIEFKPKNDRDLAFSGYMKVIDDNWALSEITLSIPQNANLNYVNALNIFQSFQQINDSLTFFHINDTQAELKITKDKSLLDIEFIAQVNKRSIYDNVKINFPVISPDQVEDIWGSINPVKKVSKYKYLVSELRPEELSPKEQNAIISIDSLNNNWKIKSADALSKMFITGYIPGDIIDLGPYLELVKNNRIEGYRYTFAGRTSSTLTKNTMLYGHVGYGTRDKQWKYGVGLQHKFKNKNRRLVTLDYRNDLSKIGDNRSIFLIKENMMVTGEDNVIASIFTNYPLDKLSQEISYRFEYEYEWKTGVTSYASINNKTIYSGEFLPFTRNNVSINNFNTSEVMLGLRLSWRENYTDNYCRRFYMMTANPIINIRLKGGRYQLNNITDNYLTARAVINHDVNIGQTKFEYLLESGITLGTVPFPLLDINRTNQSLGYALFSFNMMNEMEFASDRFVSLMAQYHLNGFILNRIPILKSMGIREVVSAKVLWSHLSNKHSAILDFPVEMYDARLPYTELSIGIENFFQYFRFDLVWRMSQLQNPGANPIGIRARFDVVF